MALQKLRSPNKRTALRGGRTGTASSLSQSKAQRSGFERHRSNGSADPKTSFDRYTALARAAATSGDAIESENYYQHAEHFFRLMKEKTA